jgi:hypothetical protein
VPLGWERWGIIIGAGGGLFIAEETRKAIFPRLFSAGKWRPVKNRWVQQITGKINGR